MTWQGRNAVDDDGDGLPNLLDRGLPARKPTASSPVPAAGVRRARRAAAGVAGPHAAHRYDVTTDVALARGQGPRLEGHTGVVLPSDARWLPRAHAARAAPLRATAGGTVASFGVDSLRRQVTLTPRGRAGRPDAGRDDRRSSARRCAPLRALTPTRRASSRPPTRSSFFAGTTGAFGPFATLQEAQRARSARPRLAAAVTERPQTGRAVISATQVGKGVVLPLPAARAAVAAQRAARPTRRSSPSWNGHGRCCRADPRGPSRSPPSPRPRRGSARAAMLAALVLVAVLLPARVLEGADARWLREHPALAAAAATAALALALALARVFARRPEWLAVAAVAVVPFRVPIASGHGIDGDPRPPARGRRRRDARLRGAAPRSRVRRRPRTGARRPRPRPRRGARALRRPGRVLGERRSRARRARPGARALRAALRPAEPAGLDAAAGARLPCRARRRRGRARGRCGARGARPRPHRRPGDRGGDALRHGRPRRIGLLRPGPVRPPPRRRRGARRRLAAVDPAATRGRRRRRRARRALGRPRARGVADELRRAARRPGRARRAALRRAAHGARGRAGRRRGGEPGARDAVARRRRTSTAWPTSRVIAPRACAPGPSSSPPGR